MSPVRAESARNQPWFIRAIKGDKRFWRPEENDSFELQSAEIRTKE